MADKAEKQRFNFTVAMLKFVEVPSGKDRVYVYDAKTPGLTMLKTAGGAASFYVYKKVRGQPQRVRLGGFPELSIEQARTLASGTALKIAAGGNPNAEKRIASAETTLGNLFDHYMTRHGNRKRTGQQDENTFKRYLDPWRNRRLTSIDFNAVEGLHIKIGRENGHYVANRMLALLSSVYNKTQQSLKWPGANPAIGVKRFEESKRKRFMNREELVRFAEGLRTEPDEMMRDFFTLALATGARRGNLQSMEWSEIDFDRGVWTIPASKAKGKADITVHLHRVAVNTLGDRRRAVGPDARFVFPSHSATGHLMEPKTAWAALLTRTKIKDLRIHDLRRTFGSWQAIGGASLNVIGQSMGHRSVQTTAGYAYLIDKPVFDSVHAAVDVMFHPTRKLLGPTKPGTEPSQENKRSDRTTAD